MKRVVLFAVCAIAATAAAAQWHYLSGGKLSGVVSQSDISDKVDNGQH